MDQGGGHIRRLIAAFVTAILGGAALAASPPDVLQSLWWTAPGHEMVAATKQPSVCLSYSEADAKMVYAGQALFNTPALLGGQAAKANLSCASCHANGRDNPHFFVQGLSKEPGTADVTIAFFSLARANAVADAARIPDLAQPGKISRADNDPALGRFIRTLIVEEFSGKEPSAATLSALASYVRSIRTCEGGAPQARTVRDQIALIDAAFDGLQGQSDPATTQLLIRAIRHQLGLIHERYPGARFAAQRQALLDSSRHLETLGAESDSGSRSVALAAWYRDFKAEFASGLIAAERHSLYNERVFSTALKKAR